MIFSTLINVWKGVYERLKKFDLIKNEEGLSIILDMIDGKPYTEKLDVYMINNLYVTTITGERVSIKDLIQRGCAMYLNFDFPIHTTIVEGVN